jgi:hypothetical protein
LVTCKELASEPSSSNMPTATTPQIEARNAVPFPPASTFDIIPEIYALIARVQSGELLIRDLNQAAVPIKLKIQKAKAAIQALPDIDRTIAEQEQEIKDLEGQVKVQETRIRELQRRMAAGSEDRHMEDAD